VRRPSPDRRSRSVVHGALREPAGRCRGPGRAATVEEPQPQRVCRAVRSLDQARMPSANHPPGRASPANGRRRVCRPLPCRAQSSGPRQRHPLPIRRAACNRRSHPPTRAARRPPELLPAQVGLRPQIEYRDTTGCFLGCRGLRARLMGETASDRCQGAVATLGRQAKSRARAAARKSSPIAASPFIQNSASAPERTPFSRSCKDSRSIGFTRCASNPASRLRARCESSL
jgi:hypothetical protein